MTTHIARTLDRSVGGPVIGIELTRYKPSADLAVYRSIYVINGSRLIAALFTAATF